MLFLIPNVELRVSLVSKSRLTANLALMIATFSGEFGPMVTRLAFDFYQVETVAMVFQIYG